ESIKLNMKKFDEIVSLSKQAAELAAERKKLMDKEKQTIDKAYETFTEAESLIEDIDDADLKKKANRIVELNDQRYQQFSKLYDGYVSSIELDKKLYEMLQNEDLNPDKLQKQVNEINEKYKEINEMKKKFNEHTEKYNDAKKEFYQAADLNVIFAN